MGQINDPTHSGADPRLWLGGPGTLQKILKPLQNICFLYYILMLDPAKIIN